MSINISKLHRCHLEACEPSENGAFDAGAPQYNRSFTTAEHTSVSFFLTQDLTSVKPKFDWLVLIFQPLSGQLHRHWHFFSPHSERQEQHCMEEHPESSSYQTARSYNYIWGFSVKKKEREVYSPHLITDPQKWQAFKCSNKNGVSTFPRGSQQHLPLVSIIRSCWTKKNNLC